MSIFVGTEWNCYLGNAGLCSGPNEIQCTGIKDNVINPDNTKSKTKLTK